MSVAFRRESDEEHKEPRFELPLPPGPNLVTPRGFALIKARIAALEAELAGADETSREPIKRDLRYWHARASSAEIAPAPPPDLVAFGTAVTYELGGVMRTIAIVGSDEADPATDRVTFTAPLVRAMMGSAAGDAVSFNGKEDAIRVIRVMVIDGEEHASPD